MKKKNTQEEITFTLPDTLVYNQKISPDQNTILNYFKDNIRMIFFFTAIFGSYGLLSLSIVLYNNFSRFIPLVFSSFMAVILRGILGPIKLSTSDKSKVISHTVIEKVKENVEAKEKKNTTFLNCKNCGELTGKDPYKATLFCDSCGMEFTKRSSSRPIGITAKKKLQTTSSSIVNDEENQEHISEYLKVISETIKEEAENYSQSEPSTEDLFLKKLDDVQKLLKLKQDKIREFKQEKIKNVPSFEKKRQSADLETVKNVKFTCQACNKEHKGLIKRINGYLFVVYENEDLILQKTNTGYTFYYEHKVEKATHQTFINLGKGFNVLSSEVIISNNGLASKKKRDTTTISDQEKFISGLKYPCSICKTDFKVKNYTKIKYESANHSTFVHIQTQHVNNNQHHLATLRIDLIDKMLVATPNVQLITPIQMIVRQNDSEQESKEDSEKQVEVTV